MKISQAEGKIQNIRQKTATALILVAAILFPLTAFGQLIQNPIVTPFFLELLDIIVKAVAAITGAVAVIVILSAAFLYMTAKGNVEVIKRAHKMILYSLGAVVAALILLALPAWIQNFFASTAQ